MHVYTSYFDNAGFLRELGVIAVGISRFPPKEFTNNNLYIFAPSAEVLLRYKNGEINKDQYKSHYIAQLRNTNFADMFNAIDQISKENDNKDVALCCFEYPNKFCHRHLLAEFLNSYGMFGGDIHEFTAKDEYADCKSHELF